MSAPIERVSQGDQLRILTRWTRLTILWGVIAGLSGATMVIPGTATPLKVLQGAIFAAAVIWCAWLLRKAHRADQGLSALPREGPSARGA